MASQASESRDLLERWKAEHPELVGNGGAAKPPPPTRPRLVPPPPPPRVTQESPQAMIERWRAEHPELAAGRPQPRVDPAPAPRRDRDDAAGVIDIGNTPLTVLAAFIIGCIIGGIAMTIVTGIAVWGFSGA